MLHSRTIQAHQAHGYVWTRLVPIMLLKLPVMLWSNAPELSLLCSNHVPLCSTISTFSLIMPKLHNHKYQQPF